MKHIKSLIVMLALIVVLAVAVVPAAAQDEGSGFPVNTITVTGYGEAFGSPDIATMDIGVETSDPDVAVALQNTNSTMDAVIAALVEAGVARQDIRTSYLNIWRDLYPVQPMMMPGAEGSGQPEPVFRVTNQISVTVRDTTKLPAILQAAVDAGATNIYGPNFGIDDRAALETAARADAMSNAQARAAEYAGLIGAELGEVVVVSEGAGGYYPPVPYAANLQSGLGGGGGAPIEPGQLSVNIQVQVTYRINR